MNQQFLDSDQMGFFSKKRSVPSSNYSEGDIFYTSSEGQYHTYKLLKFDPEFETYHVLIYTALDKLPTIADLDHLDVSIYHAPIDRKGFSNPVLLTNKPIKSDDLIGYHEYLRQTQDPSDYIPLVNSYYQAGLVLTDAKLHEEAIDAYSKAIDLFPQFFEAIDNRAFCKMDLARWNEAIEDFNLSLQVNPNSVLAEFSIGECYFKMKDYPNAKSQFEKAQRIDPTHDAPRLFLDKVNKIING